MVVCTLVCGLFGFLKSKMPGVKSIGPASPRVNGIIVDHDGFGKINGFQKCVAESLKVRRVGYEVRVGLNIFQGIDFSTTRCDPALLIDDFSHEFCVHIHQIGIFPHPHLVVKPFVTGCM